MAPDNDSFMKRRAENSPVSSRGRGGRAGHRRGQEPRTPPGTLNLLPAEVAAPPVNIHVFWYDHDHVEEKEFRDAASCKPYVGRQGTTWIDVRGIGDPSVLQWFGEEYKLHALALEDVQGQRERPKVETYDTQKFVVFRLLRQEAEAYSEQIAAFLTGSTLITFREAEADPWEPVRNAIRGAFGEVRSTGADFLLYLLIDAALDETFPVLEAISDQLEDVEQAVIDNPTPEIMDRIFTLKRSLLTVRKTVWPEREVVVALQQDMTGLVSGETKTYLRDAYDHTVQLMDMLEICRDLSATILDAYLSSISNRMNDTMKALTIISTIFVPLTFIVGVYGMNFRYIPEIEWKYGYFFAWGLMVVVVLLLVRYFRKRNWI